MVIFILIILTFIFTTNVNSHANSNNDYVYLGGESIGIDLKTEVFITGKFDVKTKNGDISPWKNSDIEIGDIIKSINNTKINSIKELQPIICNTKEKEVSLVLSRNNNLIKTSILVVQNEEGINSIGLYIKDSIVGVGTITYIQNDKKFGALGHSVSNSNINVLSGNLTYSNVQSVRKAMPGIPGEKRANLMKEVIGTITQDTDYGIFGTIKSQPENEQMIEIAKQSDIKIGNAQIVTVISGIKKEFFDIDIIEIAYQAKEDVKGIKFKVTDKELLKNTSGIIQGMSGSPIIQNNKLIGAVSHVIVDTPDYGYGVHIKWMLQNT